MLAAARSSLVALGRARRALSADARKSMMFMGAPGVGKGTYASRAAPALGVPHISTGDLLRDELKAGSELGKQAEAYMARGDLVPDELLRDLVLQRLSQPDAAPGFILDGYPRMLAQAEWLEENVKLNLVVNFELPEWVLTEKILARRTCGGCGRGYNIAHLEDDTGLYMPPLAPEVEGVCDSCGGELLQRADDNEETIRHRLGIYHAETKPLEEFYEQQGNLMHFHVKKGLDDMDRLMGEIEGAL